MPIRNKSENLLKAPRIYTHTHIYQWVSQKELFWWRTNWMRPAITAYCSIMQSNLESGLWVKNFYSCYIIKEWFFYFNYFSLIYTYTYIYIHKHTHFCTYIPINIYIHTHTYIHIYTHTHTTSQKYFHFSSQKCWDDVLVVKAMDCGIIVSEFVLHSRYYVHFWAKV